MNVSEGLTEIIQSLEQFLEDYDRGVQKTIVVLDDCEVWLEDIKRQCKGNEDIITISDTEEFKAFVHQNGISKLFIDITGNDQTGIDLATEMKLEERTAEIFFVGEEQPSPKDAARISNMGATFIEKRHVMDEVIFQ